MYKCFFIYFFKRFNFSCNKKIFRSKTSMYIGKLKKISQTACMYNRTSMYNRNLRVFNLPNFHQPYLYGLLLAAWASVVNYEFSKLSSCHFPILSGSTYCGRSGCCISLLESSVTSHTNYTNFAHPPISYL